MPQATLTFDLPEERSDFALAQKGPEYFSIICAIREQIRNHEKYDRDLNECFQTIKDLAYEANTEEIE